MAKKSVSSASDSSRPARLALPRSIVEEKILGRIAAGRELQRHKIRSEADIEAARNLRTKWNSYNSDLLKSCFDSTGVAESYEEVPSFGVVIVNASLAQRAESFRSGMEKKIVALESIIERLEILEMGSPPANEKAPKTKSLSDGSIFLVHGSNELAKTQVARFIEKLGLKVVVLHEQTNSGRTIIEKFEQNAALASFAVVILTGDDIGAHAERIDDLKPRARQNVILELGYFTAALSRRNVCVLYENGVEIPSDYLGVVYTPFDESQGWQLRLAKELKASGLEVDLNHVL